MSCDKCAHFVEIKSLTDKTVVEFGATPYGHCLNLAKQIKIFGSQFPLQGGEEDRVKMLVKHDFGCNDFKIKGEENT